MISTFLPQACTVSPWKFNFGNNMLFVRYQYLTYNVPHPICSKGVNNYTTAWPMAAMARRWIDKLSSLRLTIRLVPITCRMWGSVFQFLIRLTVLLRTKLSREINHGTSTTKELLFRNYSSDKVSARGINTAQTVNMSVPAVFSCTGIPS
jgi:hypothetical protein